MRNIVLFLAVSLILPAPAPADQTVTKTVCISTFGGESRTVDEARKALLARAKEAAVQEIFGEFISSRSQVENFALTSGDIQSVTVGFVRVKGDPRYFQGEGLGELCVAVDVYVTGDDLELMNPRVITKTVVVADPNLTLKEVEVQAKRQVRTAALIDYEPRLKHHDPEALLLLVHNVAYSDGQFIAGTTAFSISMTGTIYPLELRAFLETSTERSPALPEVFNGIPQVSPKQEAAGEIPVLFSIRPGSGSSAVFLAGDFIDWSPTAIGMSRAGDDGTFRVVVRLKPGQYLYKFVTDGNWQHDPGNPHTADDGFHGFNSVLDVPAGISHLVAGG